MIYLDGVNISAPPLPPIFYYNSKFTKNFPKNNNFITTHGGVSEECVNEMGVLLDHAFC